MEKNRLYVRGKEFLLAEADDRDSVGRPILLFFSIGPRKAVDILYGGGVCFI